MPKDEHAEHTEELVIHEGGAFRLRTMSRAEAKRWLAEQGSLHDDPPQATELEQAPEDCEEEPREE